MVPKWRALALVGVGLLVAGAGLSAGALWFASVGHTTQAEIDGIYVDAVPRSVDAGMFLAIAAVTVVLFALLVYYSSCSFMRDVLGMTLAASGIGVWIFAQRLLPVWREISGKPYAGARVPLLTWAGGLALVGALLVAVATPWWAAKRAPRPGVLALTAGLVIGAAVASGAAVLTQDTNHVNATTAAQVPAAALPASPAAEKWRWHSDEPIEDVKAAGAGVVVRSASGLIAFDGVTGAERWHYRRDDAKTGELRILDGGRIIATSFAEVWHGFDAITGELLWRADHLPTSVWTETTRSALISPADSGRPYRALDGRTGTVAWQWNVPDGCFSDGDTETTADVVLAVVNCGKSRQGVIFGLDASSGRQLWRYDGPVGQPGLNGASLVGLRATLSGIVLVDRRDTGTPFYLDAASGKDIGPQTGAGVLSSADGLDFVTNSGEVFHATQPRPRWSVATTLAPWQTAWFGDTIAVLAHAKCDKPSLDLTLLDRTTGAQVRRLGCLPGSSGRHPLMVAAPGALAVLESANDLVGFA
jgi:outer membrane protein assembly factor BamB